MADGIEGSRAAGAGQRSGQASETASGATETFSVTDLARLVDERLQSAFPNEVWVRGEIRDLTRARSGHVYFSLVEGSDDDANVDRRGSARFSVMLPARDRTRVNRLLRRAAGGQVRMVDGTEVRIRVRLSFYGPRGQLQLRMRSIDPAFTLGQLAAARAELLERLRAEGVLDTNRTIPMPLLPLRVALVTAAASDAAADAIDELTRSGFAFHLTVCDVPVQGATAAEAIAGTLDDVGSDDVDVVLVIRGGGSASDLSVFDHELVARAIGRHPRPVFTGIGHELDRSVADACAAYAAKTPTAAAHAVVEVVAAAHHRAEAAHGAIVAGARTRLDTARARLDDHRGRVERAANAGTRGELERLRFTSRRLTSATARQLRTAARRVDDAEGRLVPAGRHVLARSTDRVGVVAARVAAVDPARALARGWSMTRGPDGRLVRSPSDVDPGDTLSTTVAGGTLVSIVAEQPVPAGRPSTTGPGPHASEDRDDG